MPIEKLSVLDLSPVVSGSTASEALHNTIELAKFVEELGYHRYWLAEHHNTSFIASSSPEIMIGQVAAATTSIRVGSGGIMLPNHTSLKVVENFRTLEALYPGRIDLGMGRAPGTDMRTAFALRRGSREALSADDFPDQVAEVMSFFSGEWPEGHPFRNIKASPEGVGTPDIYLLGSSDFSARLAAELGLGFAFAHHINPHPALQALAIYREGFRPGLFDKPHSFLACSVICAPTDEEAEELAAPIDLAILRLGQNRRGPLATVEEAKAYEYSLEEREQIAQNRARVTVGSPDTVRRKLTQLAEMAQVSEIMVTTMMHSSEDRKRSYQLLSHALSPVRA
jgi:luciferase family oxidoreductase group 1